MTELKQYECHKKVHACPMDRGEYNVYRGWCIPENEDPFEPGYLVIYNKDTADHYESWSPTHIFNNGYNEVMAGNGSPVTFDVAATPLIKWLAENVNPHHTAIVDSTKAELLSAEVVFQTEEYLKD